MEFNLEDKFYTMMEALCDRVDYLFESYMTDGFVHYVAETYSDNRIALDIIRFSFEELDSDDRIERCRKFIQKDHPHANEDLIIHTIKCILHTLDDWEEYQYNDY